MGSAGWGRDTSAKKKLQFLNSAVLSCCIHSASTLSMISRVELMWTNTHLKFEAVSWLEG